MECGNKRNEVSCLEQVYIIAEAGVNHNGNLDIAKKLVDVAVEAGVNAVKFQTFKSEKLVCKTARKAEYQLESTDSNESQLDMLKKLELTYEMHLELINYCKEREIACLSTPFDFDSIELLEELGMELYKIPSGEITNLPYLRKIGATGKKVILSTGMSTLQEIRDAVAVLNTSGCPEISVLHCNTQYPTPMNDVNLNVIGRLREELGLEIGYSDHTEGIEVPIAAVALGATIIEKHFTLDKSMEGPDHKASLNPEELKAMVQAIRNIEQAMGSNEKQPTASEESNRAVARKSIVAKCSISEGEVFTKDNLTTKRPGTGISPMCWDEVLGQKAKRTFAEDELIEL